MISKHLVVGFPGKQIEYLSICIICIKFDCWNICRDASFKFGSWRPVERNGSSVMDIIVENMGRVNYGEPHNFIQKKGLWEGPVYLDGKQISKWSIYPLEFKQDWITKLQNWVRFDKKLVSIPGPLLVRATLYVKEPIADTFIDMSSWGKGVVFVNGFNLGRYWTSMGPQKALYLPAPLLKVGENTVNKVFYRRIMKI